MGERDRQTDRQTVRQRETETEIQRQTETDIQTQTETDRQKNEEKRPQDEKDRQNRRQTDHRKCRGKHSHTQDGGRGGPCYLCDNGVQDEPVSGEAAKQTALYQQHIVCAGCFNACVCTSLH